MLIFWSILLYFSFAVVDVMDKFLLSARKIHAISYTFFTVVTGTLLLVAWPLVYESLPAKFVGLNLLSGVFFSLTMYVFFRVLSYGEASRVVPFVFALVPVFDVLLSLAFKTNALTVKEFSALCLLVPGAALMAYWPGRAGISHLALKILAAFLFSAYNHLWQFGAQTGSSLNNLMWNRLGAAGILVLLLLVPAFKKKVFSVKQVKKKTHTSVLFLFKQALGGLNFVFLSHLLTVGKVSVVDSLAVFRYGFLFVSAFVLSKFHSRILSEETDKKVIFQKLGALALIFLGTVVFFL